MKLVGLMLAFVALTNSEALSVSTREAKALNVDPVGVTQDHSNGLPLQEKITLVKADERLGLWRTEKGDLVKMVPFVGEIKQEPTPNHVRSFVRQRQDSLGYQTKPFCDLEEHGSNDNRRSFIAMEGTRAGRTFWPFTNWFYDDPYYIPPPPPPMPLPYPAYPPGPMPPPYGPPMYPPPW